MYVAKSQGRGCYRVFEPDMQETVFERLELLADLPRALERADFVLQYQPILLLRTAELFGVEALVRWHHPRRGVIQPREFIPIAEDSGAIVALGSWVLDEACRQAAAWQEKYGGPRRWIMSVNVSVHQLKQPDFVDRVAATLAASGLAPERLTLEITESVLLPHEPAMLDTLRALKALGVGLAIDDFGTGYSSIAYLRDFPFDLLKIDKSFIDDVGTPNANIRELTKAIVELGKTLDLELVAEGIERSEQLSGLQSMDCELGQGFYFAEPLDSSAVEQLFSRYDTGADAA
jgi:EAL domain-containing protein (putative c-di-GMP-specific phosphodiesterase class I)